MHKSKHVLQPRKRPCRQRSERTPRLKVGVISSVKGAVRDTAVAAIDNHCHDPEFLRVLIEQAPRLRELLAKVAERHQELFRG